MSSPDPAPRKITPVRVLVWMIPFFLSLGVLALTFAMNWEPWFGYAAVLAGALGSLMAAGQALGVTGE